MITAEAGIVSTQIDSLLFGILARCNCLAHLVPYIKLCKCMLLRAGGLCWACARSLPCSVGHSLTVVCVFLSNLPTLVLGPKKSASLGMISLCSALTNEASPGHFPSHFNCQITHLSCSLIALVSEPRFLTSFHKL